MPLFIVAAVVAIGAAIGAGAKNDVFKKANETTVRDTVAFELQAAEQVEARAHAKVERLRARLDRLEEAAPASAADPAEPAPENAPDNEPRA